MSDDKKLFEHPDYAANSADWLKYRDLYEGKHAKLTESIHYLWPHEVESSVNGGSKKRALRQKYSRYLNLTEPVVSRWQSFFFKNAPTIPDSVQKLFGDEIKDVTGTGRGLIPFLKEDVLLSLLLYGKALILTDSYPIKAPNAFLERKAGLRPYFELLHPLEVKDWQISSDPANRGKYEMLRCEYESIEPRSSLWEEPKKGLYSRILYLKNGKYTGQLVKAERDPNSNNAIRWTEVGTEIVVPEMTEIPVAFLNGGDSWVKDVAEQQLQLFNLMSAWATQLNYQAFQRVAVIGATKEIAQSIAIGEYVITFLNDGASIDVIEPSDTGALERAIGLTIDWLFKVAFNQVYSIRGDSKLAPAAESQREAKEDFIALARIAIGDLEETVNQAIRHYAQFKGIKDFQEGITLSKEITVDDVDQQIAIFQAFADDFKQLPTFHKAVVKKMTTNFDLTIDEQKAIEKELDGFRPAPAGPVPAQQIPGGDFKARTQALVNGTATFPAAA